MPLNNFSSALTVQGVLSTALDLGTASFPLTWAKSMSLANGTGAGQADRLWTDRRTIAASGTDDLDLAGTLTDPFGATITFVKVKGIFVAASSTNTNNVVVGGAAANQFVGPFGAATHTVAVPPGQLLALTNGVTGWTVTAGTGDLLRFANSGAGTTVDYDVLIVGTSA